MPETSNMAQVETCNIATKPHPSDIWGTMM